MNATPELSALLREYASLASQPYRSLTLDQIASLKYYNAELDYQNGALGDSRGALVARWIRDANALETFVARTGSFPRDNRRLPREAFTPEHRHLITWVNTQVRGSALGNRCTFQVRLLQLIPGYASTSRYALWESLRLEYNAFVTAPGNAIPSPRSDDDAVRHLGQWRARQRAAYRRGQLAQWQIESLESIPGWAWPRGATI
jgi:hypothetical protein